MSTADLERTAHLEARRHAPDPDPLDPADALGHDDPPAATPPHVCWQDADPWCPVCGPAWRAWVREAS